MAVPFIKRGGGKGLVIKKLKIFYLRQLISIYIQTLKFVGIGIFTGLLQQLPKNTALSVQKIGGDKKLSKSISGYIKTKKQKNPTAITLKGGRGGGGGDALVVQPLREELFFAASLSTYVCKLFGARKPFYTENIIYVDFVHYLQLYSYASLTFEFDARRKA